MAARLLRGCLTALGATGIIPIEYIETLPYGKAHYLDKVCNAINENLSYNQARTEAQPDSCRRTHSAYMYPSNCSGWLGDDCSNGCLYQNYKGFYCKGIYKSVTKKNQIKYNFSQQTLFMV